MGIIITRHAIEIQELNEVMKIKNTSFSLQSLACSKHSIKVSRRSYISVIQMFDYVHIKDYTHTHVHTCAHKSRRIHSTVLTVMTYGGWQELPVFYLKVYIPL